MSPPLKDWGDWDSSDHTSDSFSFQVLNAFSSVFTIQLSIGNFLSVKCSDNVLTYLR